MTVQHQLEVYIELIINFCASSAKKVVHVIVSNLLWFASVINYALNHTCGIFLISGQFK